MAAAYTDLLVLNGDFLLAVDRRTEESQKTRSTPNNQVEAISSRLATVNGCIQVEDMANVEQKLSNIGNDVDCVRAEVVNVRNEVDSVRNEVDNVSRQLASVRNEVDSVRTHLDIVKNRFGGVKRPTERQLDLLGRRIICPAGLFQRASVKFSRASCGKRPLSLMENQPNQVTQRKSAIHVR